MSTGATQTTPEAGASPPREDEFTARRQVFEPHRAGLPPILPYVRELWRRREFAFELSRTELRVAHFNTVFGQAWLVINPLLLAGVYFVLVDILRSGHRPPGFFAHLVGALFAYYFVSDAVRQSIRAVTSGGKLILNTSFPRILLPISSVITGVKRFLPTLLVYIPVHLLSHRPVDLQLLWLIPIAALLLLLATGLATIVSAAQVYFRDLKNFLPYALRVWLYISPVLYVAHEVPDRYHVLLVVNPLASMLTAWSDVLDNGATPAAQDLLIATIWGVGVFLVGAAFFMSREREFAVRL
jgi:teichoic acid transport system permease protein